MTTQEHKEPIWISGPQFEAALSPNRLRVDIIRINRPNQKFFLLDVDDVLELRDLCNGILEEMKV